FTRVLLDSGYALDRTGDATFTAHAVIEVLGFGAHELGPQDAAVVHERVCAELVLDLGLERSRPGRTRRLVLRHLHDVNDHRQRVTVFASQVPERLRDL